MSSTSTAAISSVQLWLLWCNLFVACAKLTISGHICPDGLVREFTRQHYCLWKIIQCNSLRKLTANWTGMQCQYRNIYQISVFVGLLFCFFFKPIRLTLHHRIYYKPFTKPWRWSSLSLTAFTEEEKEQNKNKRPSTERGVCQVILALIIHCETWGKTQRDLIADQQCIKKDDYAWISVHIKSYQKAFSFAYIKI